MKIASPKFVFSKITNQLSTNDYIVLLTSIISGVLIHFHILSSRVTNPDVVWETPQKNGYAWEVALGRWGIEIIDFFKHNLVLPVCSMIFTIIMLAVISVIINKYFQIDHLYSMILITLLLQSFPMVGETLTYFYCSDAYMISFLLALVSVIILSDNIITISKYILSFAILTFSIGIYQAFVGVYIVIACITIFNMLLIKKEELKTIFKYVVRYVLVLGVSLVAYFIVAMLVRKYYGIETASYRGMDSMFQIALADIPSMIVDAYTVFFRYFLDNYISNNPWWGLNILFICCFVSIILLIVYKVIKEQIYKDVFRTICIVGLLILLPMLFCLIVFLTGSTNVSYLMLPQMIFLFVWLVYLAEKIVVPILEWVTFLCVFCVIVNWIQLDNAMYNAIEIEYDKTYALGARIIERVEEYPEFDYSKPIALYGCVDNPIYPDLYPKLSESVIGTVGDIGWIWQNNWLVSQTSWYHFFQRYYGVTFHYCNSEEKLNAIYQSEEFLQMDYFPGDGAIKEVDGVIVIKLAQ